MKWSDDEDYQDQQDRERSEQWIPQPILQVSEALFAISIYHCIQLANLFCSPLSREI
jgi:hypothetical protein